MSDHSQRMANQLYEAAAKVADSLAQVDEDLGKLAKRKLEAVDKNDLGQVHTAGRDIRLMAEKELKPKIDEVVKAWKELTE